MGKFFTKIRHIRQTCPKWENALRQLLDHQVDRGTGIDFHVSHTASPVATGGYVGLSPPVAYAENYHGGGFIQWHMVVICIWCALFVTSQLDVIFMFPNQRFGDVCWHNRHILLHALPYFMCHCTEYKLLALKVAILEENKLNATTQQFITAKISGCVLKQGSKTLINASEQFTTEKLGCADVLSNTSSRA